MTQPSPAQWPRAFAPRPVVVMVSAATRRCVMLALLTFILSGCGALTVVNRHDKNGGRARVEDRKFAGRVAVSAAPAAVAATTASCTASGACSARCCQRRTRQTTYTGILSMGVATYAWPRPRINRWIQQTLTGDHVMKVSSLIFAIDED